MTIRLADQLSFIPQRKTSENIFVANLGKLDNLLPRDLIFLCVKSQDLSMCFDSLFSLFNLCGSLYWNMLPDREEILSECLRVIRNCHLLDLKISPTVEELQVCDHENHGSTRVG
jgi:hypothetical protein